MADNNYNFENALKENQTKSSSVFNLKKTFPAYLVLILFLILSYFIWNQTKLMVNNNNEQEFRKATNSVISRLEAKKQRKLEIINSISVLFDIFPFKVPKDYFELYSTVPTMTYPSILAVIYAPKVTEEEKAGFIYNTKSMGYYTYDIIPEGTREVYYPSEYIIPLEKNTHQLGYDYFTNEDLNKSINKAKLDNILVTSPVKNYGRKDTVSFYMISPLYKKNSVTDTETQRKENFDAAVMLEIKADLYFKNAINSAVNNEMSSGFASDSTIYFRIYDIDYNNNKNVVYESGNSEFFNDASYKPLLHEIVDYRLADRIIKIEFATVPGFGGALQEYLPLITLIVSVILSIAFFGFLLSLITSRARAVDLAEKMTRSQRRIVETSNDMIAILDFNLEWKSMNPASNIVLGYEPDEMMNSNLKQFVKNDTDFQAIVELINTAQDDVHNKLDIEMKSKNDEIKWVSWNLTISKTDNVIYALGRDVTLEKYAEQEAILKSKQIQLAEKFAQEASQSKSLFMTKLSHQLRNNLTSIIGYLQLIEQKAYDNEEEHDNYIQLAEESSEEVFTFVNDIIEATLNTQTEKPVNYELVRFDKIIDNLNNELKEIYSESLNVELVVSDDSLTAKAMADGKLLVQALVEVIQSLTQNEPDSKVEMFIQENQFEKMTEVQILASENVLTDNMIALYKGSHSIIEDLSKDNDDVLFRLASASSIIKRLNGTITIDSFGGKDGNVVMISLPLNNIAEN
jgi:PAS domain S-box-containing protein